MPGYLNKYNIEIDGHGYMISKSRDGQPYYQKKLAPAFVNKFGSGDSSYRDSTFWQFWASTNWRNGAKQLRLDDTGKFWKSQDVNVNQLDEITLSRALTSIGQTASGVKVNALEPFRTSQSWWNASYGYRQQLTVTAPASQQVPVGYPVKITIDTATLQSDSKVRSDRNDWRVVYFNGSSLVELKRDYITTTSTYFGLQNAIAAGGTDSNYYVYYGYSSESTNSQPSSESEWNSVYGMYGTTPDANTVAIYHMREGSGTTLNDDSSSTNTGTITNASGGSVPTWATGGKLGRYLDFTSTNKGYVSAADHSTLDLSSMTLEGWVYFKTSALQYFIAKGKDGTDTKVFQSFYSGGHWGVETESGSDPAQTSGGMTISEWHHIAITYDGSDVFKYYLDGTLDSSPSTGIGALINNDKKLFIGTSQGSAGDSPDTTFGYFNGYMQHLRISNTPRTSFPYVLTSEPTVTSGTETTTQPSSSSFDLFAGCSNGKLYKWDGATTMTEQFDASRITWYETGNDTNMVVGDTGGTETAQGQSFQVGSVALKVQGLEVYLKKSAGTPGTITVRIETESASKPSGTLADANATTTISAFTTTSYGWISVTFPASFQLSASTAYWIVLKTAAAANDNNYSWAADGSSPTYSSGTMATSTDGGSTWTADSTKDAYFRIKGESTSINDLLVSAIGGTRKLLIATGDITNQTNANARLYSFDGSNYALEKTFGSSVEAQITKLAEFNSKLYAGVGPQARIYEGTSPSSWTLSKDIDVPQNPGYIYAMKEYNGRLYVGGGSPELLYDKHYNGFWYSYDSTTWSSLYPFDFTEIRAFEFYDAFLFGTTYHGHIYVYDTATLNPLFNFKDDFKFNVSILDAQLFDDKIYFLLSPQENFVETNVGVWVFDRHGMSLAFTKSGVTGFRCAAVVNNTLVIGTGNDGYVYKLDSTAYTTQGYVQTSYFDANLPSIDKLYNSVVLQHDPLNEGESIVVYYKFKESDSWTSLGTSNTVTSASKTLSFPSATSSKKISLKIELNTTDTSTTPKVKEVVLQYSLLPVRKWQWTMKLIAKKNQKLLDGTFNSSSATTIRTNLETSQNSSKLVTFTDVDSTQYTVLFNELDQSSWVVNQADVNENEIAVSLIEA